jgi:hypothetical protein
MRQTGYPGGRAGYVVDHIIPLSCGGPDTPENMQWQTVVEAKAKDRTTDTMTDLSSVEQWSGQVVGRIYRGRGAGGNLARAFRPLPYPSLP